MKRNSMWRILALSLVLYAVGGGVAGAQDIEPRESFLARIESEPQGAEVYSGDSLLGLTPVTIPLFLARSATVYYPARLTVNVQVRQIGEGALPQHLGVNLFRFVRKVQLRSLPHGAAIFRGDSMLGRTPMDVDADSGAFMLHLPGYESREVHLDRSDADAVLITLNAVVDPPSSGFMVRSDRGASVGLDILLPAGLSLLAGIAAVVLKQYADGRYDEYLRTHADALLSEAKKYDIYAGISLAALQLGLGYFIVRLFEE